MNGTIEFLDYKNIDLDTKIIIRNGLVKKLLLKTYFCKVVANVTHWHMSNVQITQDIKPLRR